ncbi:hypothetical protein ACYEXS_34150 [Paenibacillus sp. MAH-36]|nr:hypothetical protein [Paenibacillus sp. PFR10]
MNGLLKMSKKAKIRTTVVLLVLSIILFYLVNLFTIDPYKTSGNGNLGLVPILFSIPIFIGFNIFYFLVLRTGLRKVSNKIKALIFIICLIILVVFFLLELNFVKDLSDLLGSWDDLNSRVYRYPILNQYTNTMFFNKYTFLTAVTITTLIGIVYPNKNPGYKVFS